MKRWISIVVVGAGLLIPTAVWAGEHPKHQHYPAYTQPPAVDLKPGKEIDLGYNHYPQPVKPFPGYHPTPPRRPHWEHTSWSDHYRCKVYWDREGRGWYWCQPDGRFRPMDDAPYGRYDFGDPPEDQ